MVIKRAVRAADVRQDNGRSANARELINASVGPGTAAAVAAVAAARPRNNSIAVDSPLNGQKKKRAAANMSSSRVHTFYPPLPLPTVGRVGCPATLSSRPALERALNWVINIYERSISANAKGTGGVQLISPRIK